MGQGCRDPARSDDHRRVLLATVRRRPARHPTVQTPDLPQPSQRQPRQRHHVEPAGEDAYLLPRDKGPVRRFVRDVVDSRRNVLGLFMPSALGLIFVMLAVPSAAVQRLLSPAMLVLVLIMVIDGFIVGRKVNRMVDEKFPDNTESGWKLGFYAASRASQLRRMRAPRPQVNRGDSVS